MKRNLPSTSHDSNRKATHEMRQAHWNKIKNALSVLGTANYEKIAEFVGLDKHSVGRRTKEMEGLGMIYKPGTKTMTSKNREAFDYCLTGQGMPKTDKEVIYKEGEKTAAQYASKLATPIKQLEIFV